MTSAISGYGDVDPAEYRRRIRARTLFDRANPAFVITILAPLFAVVWGGSQALSRSFDASMTPKALSGEFLGFFSVTAKFSAIIGPLWLVAAVAAFGSSRPAVLGLIVFFVVGISLLARGDETEGRRVAREADEAAAAAGIVESG